MENWNKSRAKGQAPLEIRHRRCLPQRRQGSLTGQAILELAIFGSILIMLLGILINYGLRYGYQQQVMQQAFRKALASATESMAPHKPTSVSYVVVRDRHIPNPSDTFAVGSVMPFSAGGSVTRSYKLDESADYEDELPQMAIDIQGQTYSFKTAGFRQEYNVKEESLDRYKEIYGETIQGWAAGSGWVKVANADKTCIRWGEEVSSPASGGPLRLCEEYVIDKIRFIDPSAGELMNYDTAVRQCRLIVDTKACIDSCEEGEGTNCAATCNLPMEVPWYCANYVEINKATHQYNFPILNQVFALNPDGSMGLQEDYTQINTIDNKLSRKETASGITTTDNLNWQVKTERDILYKPYGDTTTKTETKDVSSSVSQNKTQTWQTDW